MTSFLFRALIYYHVKRNNASQLKRFLQKSRQSCPWRAQYKQNAPKNRRKHRQLHAFCPLDDRANLERTVRSSRIELAIWARWDKNCLTCARNYAILRMEPPKERFRRANNPKVGSTPNIAAPLFQIAPNNLQTPLSNTLIAFGGSIQKIFMCSPPRAGYALKRRKVQSVWRYRSINYF